MERRNRINFNLALAVATLGVGAGGEVLPPAPPAKDEKPERRQSTGAIGYGIPFEHLKNNSQEFVGAPGSNPARREKRERRKARMRLRKRRGWR